MEEPPNTLDGADVLEWANLQSVRPTGRTTHTVGGEVITDFAGLALARYSDAPNVYLFYCGDAWDVLTDTAHDDLEAAKAQAEFEFEGIDWITA